MDKVAQVAPVSKATLYRHFENKKALLAGVVTELCATFLQTMTLSSGQTESLENTLKRIAGAFVDLIYSENALAIYRLVIAESREFPELSQLFYDSGPKVGLKQLEAYLLRFNHDAKLRSDNSAFSADAFFSLLKGDLHMQCLLGIKPLPSEAEKKQLIDQAIIFYLYGMHHAVQ